MPYASGHLRTSLITLSVVCSRIGIPHVAELVCGERKGQKLEECRVSVREALVPVYLHCMSPTNSLMACTEVRNLASAQTDAEKPTCLEETNAVTECQRVS